VTHIFLKVANAARIDPPIQVLYFLSGGANILIFVSFGADNFTSLSKRSPNPVNMMNQRQETRTIQNEIVRENNKTLRREP
jgi:hypothetical protein